jgi:excinuclease UvrABC nuclease subunit
MKSQEVKKSSAVAKAMARHVAKLPDAPGVYVFKCSDKILYIGKATSLRDRVRSYFNPDIVTTRSPLISKMLSEFDSIEHMKTDSVLEALVLEANLIKKYQPEANIKEKDNRSFNFVVITDEDFPRVLIMRGRELLSKSPRVPLGEIKLMYTFGPFPSGGQLREAMKIVRKMFPYRDKCEVPKVRPLGSGFSRSNLEVLVQSKPCFNRQIGLCPGVCTGEISKEEYAKQIQNIVLFFEGHKKRLIKNLEKQMGDSAKKKEFERAQQIKKTIFTLSHIQDVALIKDTLPARRSLDGLESTARLRLAGSGRAGFDGFEFRIESYDIAHLSGTNVVGVMTVVEDGEVKKSDYRKFKIRSATDGANNNFFHGLGIFSEDLKKIVVGGRFINDTKALSEVLTRRLGHIEWRLPDLIVVDGGTAQKRAMEKVLRENKINIPVVSVVKDEYHRPKQILGDKKWLVYEREILLSNSEAHRFAVGFHKHLRGKIG